MDTGAFLGRYLEGDQHHGVACAKWTSLARTPRPLSTSNLVISETLTLLARKAGHEFALRKAALIYSSSELRILRPDGADELRALEFFKKFADQDASFTDCVSFALMRRLRYRTAFSFDRHFKMAGFEIF